MRGGNRGPGEIRSIQNFDAVVFDDGIGEDFLGDGLDILTGLFGRDGGGDGDLEVLALTHILNAWITEALERGADRLTLRVQDGGLQRNKNAGSHGESRLSHARWSRACKMGGDEFEKPTEPRHRRLRFRRG